MIERLKTKWSELQDRQGIILFVIVLVATHLFWKFTVTGEITGDKIMFLDYINLSPVFNFMSHHLAVAVNTVMHALGFDTHLSGTTVCHDNGTGCGIVWGCTGLKQGFIFAMTILFARGRLQYKIPYIILGLAAVYLFNVLRLTILVWLVHDHVGYFDLVHGYLLKYLFYIIIFAMWAVWDRFQTPAHHSGHRQ